MICTSIRGRNLEEIWALLQNGEIEMAEIRLDLCPLSGDDVAELFSATDLPLVATCRRMEDVEKTLAAIEAGAKFADVDLELPTAVRKQVRSACEEYGTALIVSCHDENETPAEAVLHSMMERCQEAGADIVKIVTLAQTAADAERVLGLYKDKPSRMRLIAFAMGEAGRASRLTCLRRGAPFTYAAVAAGEETAPGQWTTAEMWETVYSRAKTACFALEPAKIGNSSANSAHFVTELPIRPAAPIPMPAAKSFAQRAILCAALADGISHLSGYTPCGDSEAAIGVAEALGATVRREGDTLVITGIAATPGCLRADAFHTGESGLLTRLLIPLLAVLSDGPVKVTGEKTSIGR